MKIIGTLNNLEVLIHCHCNPTVHPRLSSESVKEAIRLLVFEGMIEQFDRHYVTTDKGAFYLSHLLSVPFPVTSFVIPEVAQ